MTVSRFNPNPKRARLVALIPTRRVSEGFCGIVRPSLTRRAGMFPLPAANQLNQQAGKRGILWDCTSLAHTSGWDESLGRGFATPSSPTAKVLTRLNVARFPSQQ
jgi:hypothetical protein